MGLRFRKSIKLGKHFSINLSPKGIGYSYGVKGARHSVSADGRHRTTYSVPGTGLTYTTSKSTRKPSKSAVRHTPSEVSRHVSQTPTAPIPKLSCPAFWLFFVLSLVFLAAAIANAIFSGIDLMPDTYIPVFVVLCIVSFVLAFHLKWRAEAQYLANQSQDSPDQPSKPANKSLGCLIPIVVIIAILYFLGCSGTSGETEHTSETLPPAETSSRTFLPPETEEPEPPISIPVVTAPETQPPTESKTPPHEVNPPETDPPAKTTYYLNTSSKKIHRAGCSSVEKIKDSNKSTTTDPDAMLAEGYTWCGICH